VDTFWTSLDHAEKVQACHETQRTLFNPGFPDCAFAYLPLYSSNHFNAFHPDLRGIVNSPGFGSNNRWTHLNIRWQPGLERYHETYPDKTVVDWIWADEPELLNPCSALTVYAWDILEKTIDGLIGINPYTLEDIPWLARQWSEEVWPDAGGPGVDWMNVTFWLNETVRWQDGHPFTADDAAFSWLFLRDWLVPRYLGMTRWLEDVEVIDTYTVRAILNTTSQFLIYDLAETAALLPPQVWDRPWPDLAAIMTYDPTIPYSVAPGYTPGPTPPPTNLFGTGPYIFQFYDLLWLYAELWQNPNYFKYTNEIFTLKVEMFHRAGDVNRDGYIDVWDLSALGMAYGTRIGWPDYNPDADLNSDFIVDARDLAAICWHWARQREYPVP
jgi:ABC-type transport system substrate-binding protein